jgi:FKBP-type peptidyl-prolyl cis-trans isomerase
MITLPSGLKYRITQAADLAAPAAQPKQQVTVHYTGWLADAQGEPLLDKKFDSSVDRGTPFTFTLGAGHVIKGWDEGIAGMKVGEKRRLFVPADLGYGSHGVGNVIPPNAALVFDLELLSVK